MIRLGKPVKLYEWGLGTNTMNQTWDPIADGVLKNKTKRVAGTTNLVIEVDGSVNRKNTECDTLKVFQQGEGMTPTDGIWGEVASGKLTSIEKKGNQSIVNIELIGAVKLGY